MHWASSHTELMASTLLPGCTLGGHMLLPLVCLADTQETCGVICGWLFLRCDFCFSSGQVRTVLQSQGLSSHYPR